MCFLGFFGCPFWDHEAFFLSPVWLAERVMGTFIWSGYFAFCGFLIAIFGTIENFFSFSLWLGERIMMIFV